MNPPASKSTGQFLFGSPLTVLAVLGAILLLQWLEQRPPGKSRIDWPAPATVPTKP